MKTKLTLKFLLSHVEEKAAKERKVFGGTYKLLFHFKNIADYFQVYGNGQIQAVGKDSSHVYFKPWDNSAFAGTTPEKILEQLGSQIEFIEVLGCGNDYKREFISFRSFLDWIEVSPEKLGIMDLPRDAVIPYMDHTVLPDKEKITGVPEEQKTLTSPETNITKDEESSYQSLQKETNVEKAF